jgi:hypothetical protein
MIPKAPESLGHMAMRVATDLIPKAADDYAGADLGLMTVMLSMVGQDFERFAEVHVREHEEMCALFREAAPHLDADLAGRVAAVLAQPQASLMASALNARADVTTRLLIDLHAFVETKMDAGEAWAKALDSRIWTFLDQHAQRRAYEVSF